MLKQGFNFHYKNYSSIAQVLVKVFKFHIAELAALSILLFCLIIILGLETLIMAMATKHEL